MKYYLLFLTLCYFILTAGAANQKGHSLPDFGSNVQSSDNLVIEKQGILTNSESVFFGFICSESNYLISFTEPLVTINYLNENHSTDYRSQKQEACYKIFSDFLENRTGTRKQFIKLRVLLI